MLIRGSLIIYAGTAMGEKWTWQSAGTRIPGRKTIADATDFAGVAIHQASAALNRETAYLVEPSRSR